MHQPSATDHPDLIRERQKANFDVERLTNIYDGGFDSTNTKRDLQRKILRKTDISTSNMIDSLDRPALFSDAVRRAAALLKSCAELGLNDMSQFKPALCMYHPFEACPLALHRVMFIPALESNGSAEQKAQWLPKAKGYEILGTYAQTEMGHGTNVRGLETTATYDPAAQEFVIHSPTRSSVKMWAGGLGCTSNHAIVMAQLYTRGQCHGVQAFIVQLRSLETHATLPGITLGDMGPKMALNSIDNGFLMMDHVKVPRENMLARYSEVKEDGSFVQNEKGLRKPAYLTMLHIRAELISNPAALCLGAAVTIAVRYSAIRRQPQLQPGAQEAQILHLQTQQFKLLPLLAATYGFSITSNVISKLIHKLQAEMDDNIYPSLPELHALTAGLKSFTAQAALAGVAQCSLACGGHGFSQASGMPTIYGYVSPGCTYEGEKTILYLQTARYVMKMYQRSLAGEPVSETVSYLTEVFPDNCGITEDFLPETLATVYRYRAKRLVQRAAGRLQRLLAGGKAQHEALNLCGVDLTSVAEAYSQCFVVESFLREVAAISDPDISRLLGQLCQLYALHGIGHNSGDYLEEGYMSKDQVRMVEQRVYSLLADVRPNAVALVDALDYPDHHLGSVLGRFDGHVYEKLYEWATESPFNKTQVGASYHEYLRPLLKTNPTARL